MINVAGSDVMTACALHSGTGYLAWRHESICIAPHTTRYTSTPGAHMHESCSHSLVQYMGVDSTLFHHTCFMGAVLCILQEFLTKHNAKWSEVTDLKEVAAEADVLYQVGACILVHSFWSIHPCPFIRKE